MHNKQHGGRGLSAFFFFQYIWQFRTEQNVRFTTKSHDEYILQNVHKITFDSIHCNNGYQLK